MADRVAFQADKTEISSKVFLWGERQRHPDTNFCHAHCQLASDALAKTAHTHVEFLWFGNNGPNCAHVLHQP